MPNPKKKIYTDKKEFDKANQLYNDSLNLYNKTLKLKKENNIYNFPLDTYNHLIAKKGSDDYNYTLNTYNDINTNNARNTKIKPVSIYGVSNGHEYDFAGIPIYKKPTQQPILQDNSKPLIKPKSTTSNKIEPYKPKSQKDFDYRSKMYNDSVKVNKDIDAWNKNTQVIFDNVKNKKLNYDEALQEFNKLSSSNDMSFLQSKVKNKNFKPKELSIQNTIDKNGESFKRIPYEFKKPVQQILPYEDDTLTKIQLKPVIQQVTVKPEVMKEIPIEQPKTNNTQVQNYTASKYLKLKGKPSGYVNMGDKKGIQEYGKGGKLNIKPIPKSQQEAQAMLDNGTLKPLIDNHKDSNFENILEIADPTGISSWDDVYRSAKENGIKSKSTMIEIMGALPLLGKLSKGAKLLKGMAKTSRQVSNINAISNAALGLQVAGKISDAQQAYEQMDQQKYADGGNMNYYDNQINKESALLQTGLGLAGNLIAPGIGGQIGKTIGGLFADGGQTQPTENLVEAGETVLTKDGKLVVYPDNGLTHEKNPNDGFKAPNEGYVFSNRLTIGNKSYADISKKIDKRYSLRKDDNISKEAKARELNDLMNHQEELRINNNMTQANKNLKKYFKKGGKLKPDTAELDEDVRMIDNANTEVFSNTNNSNPNNPIYNLNPSAEIQPDFMSVKPTGYKGGSEYKPTINNDNSLNLTPSSFMNSLTTNSNISAPEIKNYTMDNPQFNANTTVDINRPNMIKSTYSKNNPTNKNSSPNNKPLFNSKYNPLGYAQLAGSAFDIGKGLLGNKSINYKPYKPTLMNDPYTPTNLRREAGNALNTVNSTIDTSNLNAGQAIAAKMNAASTNQGLLANQLSANKQQINTYNNTLTNAGNQSAAEIYNRNIDANENVQDARANAIKTGLDTAGRGLATIGKDKDLYKSNDLYNNTMASFSNDMYSRYGLQPELDEKGNVIGFKSTFKKLNSYGGKLMKKC
jgi:hypothetical protein